MKLTIFLCLSLIATTALCGHSLSRFESRPFQRGPPNGMFLLDGLGLNSLEHGQQIIAYGDVNNDKFTDIIILDDTEKNLTVSLYSHANFNFNPNVTIISDDRIVDVTTGDFNFDGKLDLLITTVDKDKKSHVKYFFRAEKAPYYGKGNSKADFTFALADDAHPFVIDSNGNRRLDVLYVESDGTRMMRTYEHDGLKSHPFEEFVSKEDGCIEYSEVSKYRFTTPHSNIFADINGDCAADLILTTKQGDEHFIEIYLRNPKDSLFCLVEVVPVHNNISSINIGDISNNGKLDLVVVSEGDGEPLTINVIYNQFASNPLKPCTLTNDKMVSPFNNAAFTALNSTPNINQLFKLPDSYPLGTRLFSRDEIHRPGKIRIGDINIDGYPDLLFVVDNPDKDAKDGSYGSIVLVMNQDNVFTFNTWQNSLVKAESHPYYTILIEENTQDPNNFNLSKIQATSASFFDFNENGKLGLWITTKTSDTKTGLLGAFNFVSTEHFILKTLALNGFEKKDQINDVLGGLYYGASIECTVTKVDGRTILSKVAQLPQSAYSALDVPYMFLGLGRTNNYIENLYMGISRKDNKNKQQEKWTTIIPNSQLIVNPIVDKAWTLDIYVSPTSEAFLIGLVTGLILIILGAIIIYLHRLEKAEDIANQDRMIHIFG